jgi:transposase
MEMHLGRFLRKDECVHHKNGNRADNRLANLELTTPSRHMSYHGTTRLRVWNDPDVVRKVRVAAADPSIPADSLGIAPGTRSRILREHGIRWRNRKAHVAQELTEEQVREALHGRSTAEAAKLLRVHPQTLRNRFDRLLRKRASPHALDDVKEDILRELAKPLRDVAEMFGVHEETIRRALRRWSAHGAIPDVPAELLRRRPGPKPQPRHTGPRKDE